MKMDVTCTQVKEHIAKNQNSKLNSTLGIF